MASPSIVWLGTPYDPSGHADELRGFVRAQEQAGHEPALRSLKWTEKSAGLSGRDLLMLKRQEAREPALPGVAVHHYLPSPRQTSITGMVNVARAMFETDRLPAEWIGPLLTRDEIWVPCALNLETFEAAGIPAGRLRLLGETLDFELFDPATVAVEREPGAPFTFLTNFDFSERKGWKTLLRAWGRAFDADSGVRLVLKTSSFYREDGYVLERIDAFMAAEFGAARDRLAPIELRTDLLPAAEMPLLYASADAYVLPSRGEAWGRPFMEAMAMGLPTIASAWGGNREFMNPDNSWLVEGELVQVAEDAELFNDLYRGHRWFEADADALAEIMVSIAGDPDAARTKAARARPGLLERFGPEAIAATIAGAVEAAIDRHTGPGPRLVLRGPAGSDASLAVVNDGLAAALEAHGTTVRRREPQIPLADDASVGISHFWPPDFEPASGGPSVVILPWEFGPPPQAWVDEARSRLDRVWVPSAYVRDRHVAAGMPPGIVDVVPNGVDLARFTPDGPAVELPRTAGCTFLFVGGTTWRKGIDVLLEAWRAAFGPGDDVQLVIKDFGTTTWYRGQTMGDAVRALAADPSVAPIVYLGEDRPAEWLPTLYRAADAVVLPYRGEGFCLPALEAMASGVPVIHTGTGPTGEFVGDDCGWALPARQVELSRERTPEGVAGLGHVQEPDMEALVAILRNVAAAPEERRRRGAAARQAALGHGWDAAAAAARASLAALAAEGLPPARTVVPAHVEGRDTIVLYAPEWDDDPTWRATLASWATALHADDPVTLALYAGDVDPNTVFAKVMDCLGATGVPEDHLPDLALCDAGSNLLSLVKGADAVLSDPPGRGRPELVRAAQIVESAQIAAWRAARYGAAVASEPLAAGTTSR